MSTEGVTLLGGVWKLFDECQLKDHEKARLAAITADHDAALAACATPSSRAIRMFTDNLKDDVTRPSFVIDVDKILHNQFYNRYSDKTQVFSFFRNDDITRRALHVQFVSRIGRTLGRALNLNLDLIEAIALGHDIGHTPFGHRGEQFLCELLQLHTGRYFNHNVHSVRVFKDLTWTNLTLQTYDGILCHCGEKAFEHYEPLPMRDFDDLDRRVEACYTDPKAIKALRPCTLEGCVVRISDMIAYLGKDRQDAYKAHLSKSDKFPANKLGLWNYEIINSIVTNIIKNSMGKGYLKIDANVYEEVEKVKNENYTVIYDNTQLVARYADVIKPMMCNMYGQLLDDIKQKLELSPVFKHHINIEAITRCYRERGSSKVLAEPNQIVVDYIASMTDDYFIDLYKFMFPNDPLNESIKYHSYFEGLSYEEYARSRNG